MNNRSERKNGAILSYVSIIINTIVQLIYTPFVIRMLGQSEYGLFSMISSIIGYLTILSSSFGNAIIVYSSKYKARKEYNKENKMLGMFKILFLIIGIFTVVLGVIMYFISPSVFSKTMSDYEINKAKIMVLILAFNMFITFIFSIYSAVINAYEKFTFQRILNIINTLLKPLFMIPLLFLGYKSITMCLVVTLINIIVVFSNYYYCTRKMKIKIKYTGFDKSIFGEMFGYSIFILLGIIVDKVNWSVDQFILGAVVGTISVSVYSIASQLNQMFINLAGAVSGVFLPKMSKLIANNVSEDDLNSEFIKIGRIQFYIVFLMATCLIIFGKEFIILWLGDNFVESYYIALLLIIPLCFELIQNVGLSIMQAMNKYKFRSISMTIMAFFNIAISIYLAKKYGAIGTAFGTSLSVFLINVLLINIYYYKVIKLNIPEFWIIIFKMVLYYIILITSFVIFKKTIPINSFITLILYVGLYSVLYFIISYIFVMNKYEKDIIISLLKKIKLINNDQV